MALLLPPVGLPLLLPYVLTFVAEIYLLKGTIRVWRSRVAYRST